MTRRFAFTVVVTMFVSGVGAGLTVVNAWSERADVADSVSPGLWAARSYLALFDLWAIATFLPSLAWCRWAASRLAPKRRTFIDGSISSGPLSDLPFEEAL